MLNEQDLLDRISNSDETAFMSFFELYVNRVYLFINKLLKDKTESEDLTQVVFMKIWEKRSGLKEVNSISGYVFTIANRTVIDYFRSSRNKQQKLVDNNANDHDDTISHNSAEDALNKHEFEQIYAAGLSSLPTKRREIFILSRHEGLSNKEIAEKLGISVKTVENQMTSALSFLKQHFQKHDLGSFLVFLIILLFE